MGGKASKDDTDPGEIITVNAAKERRKVTDPDLYALQQIPDFKPLFPSSIKSGWADVLSKSGIPLRPGLNPLSPEALVTVCAEFQGYLRNWAATVAHEQKILARSVDTVDATAKKVIAPSSAVIVDFNKAAKTISSDMNAVAETSKQLRSLCRSLILSIDDLNRALPDDQALPPLTEELEKSIAEMGTSTGAGV